MKANSVQPRAWSPIAHQEVPRLRQAITAHLKEPTIPSSMAPLMGELLTRLEGFSTPPKVGQLQAPLPPSDQPYPSPAQATEALHTASGQLRERLLSGSESSSNAQALESMVRLIDSHLELKEEILARSPTT